jgi:hypothetical protein
LFPFILANERGDIKTPFLLVRYKRVFMYLLKERFLKKKLRTGYFLCKYNWVHDCPNATKFLKIGSGPSCAYNRIP